jgi:hypothetical protein
MWAADLLSSCAATSCDTRLEVVEFQDQNQQTWAFALDIIGEF